MHEIRYGAALQRNGIFNKKKHYFNSLASDAFGQVETRPQERHFASLVAVDWWQANYALLVISAAS